MKKKFNFEWSIDSGVILNLSPFLMSEAEIIDAVSEVIAKECKRQSKNFLFDFIEEMKEIK
jgi:hypothetical protein